jgi:O-methyltransferase
VSTAVRKLRSMAKHSLAAVGLLETARLVRKKARKHGLTAWTPLVPEDALFECCTHAIDKLREAGHDFGDYLEFGVSRGTSLACMHKVLVTRGLDEVRLIGFDSFEGMPVGADAEGWPAGGFASSLRATRDYLSKRGVRFDRTTLVKGWYQDTLNQDTARRLKLRKASLVMIDCDIYSASRAALFFAEPFIVDRSVVLFDDWGWREQVGEVGQKEAFAEFLDAFPQLVATPLPSYFEHARVFMVERKQTGYRPQPATVKAYGALALPLAAASGASFDGHGILIDRRDFFSEAFGLLDRIGLPLEWMSTSAALAL